MDYIFTPHALFEMRRRGLSVEMVQSVIEDAEQEWESRKGRHLFQSRTQMESAGKMYLVRVIVDTDKNPHEVVTAYRTSKISKYWR
jgi:hypothetical protein